MHNKTNNPLSPLLRKETEYMGKITHSVRIPIRAGHGPYHPGDMLKVRGIMEKFIEGTGLQGRLIPDMNSVYAVDYAVAPLGKVAASLGSHAWLGFAIAPLSQGVKVAEIFLQKRKGDETLSAMENRLGDLADTLRKLFT